jgi:hypothetical protein
MSDATNETDGAKAAGWACGEAGERVRGKGGSKAGGWVEMERRRVSS